MKRDFKVIRKILLQIENDIDFSDVDFENEETRFHLDLLKRNGFVKDGMSMASCYLTWSGCDLLDSMRDEET